MNRHRVGPKLLMGLPKRPLIVIYLSTVGCTALTVPIGDGVAWEQSVAYAISVAPVLLAFPLTVSGVEKVRDDDAVKMTEALLKMTALWLVGYALTSLTLAADIPNAKTGVGLLLSTLVAIANWSLLVEVLSARIYGPTRKLMEDEEPETQDR